MKQPILNLVISFTVALFAFSCSNGKINEEEMDRREIKTADSTEYKFNAMKDKYKQRVKEKMLEVDKKVESLNIKIKKANGKLKDKLKSEMEEWKIKRQKLKERLDKIEKPGKENRKIFEQEFKDFLELDSTYAQLNKKQHLFR